MFSGKNNTFPLLTSYTVLFNTCEYPNEQTCECSASSLKSVRLSSSLTVIFVWKLFEFWYTKSFFLQGIKYYLDFGNINLPAAVRGPVALTLGMCLQTYWSALLGSTVTL